MKSYEKNHEKKDDRACGLRTGIDVLEADKFSALRGLRIGLITNQTGLDRKGRRTLDLLYKAPGVKLVATIQP